MAKLKKTLPELDSGPPDPTPEPERRIDLAQYLKTRIMQLETEIAQRQGAIEELKRFTGVP